MSGLLLKGALAGTTPDVTATGLAVQLRPPDGGELLCARIAPDKFRRKGKAVRFNDKKGKLAGAGGLTSLLLKSSKNGSVALALAAKKASLHDAARGSVDDHVRLRRRHDGGAMCGRHSDVPGEEARHHRHAMTEGKPIEPKAFASRSWFS